MPSSEADTNLLLALSTVGRRRCLDREYSEGFGEMKTPSTKYDVELQSCYTVPSHFDSFQQEHALKARQTWMWRQRRSHGWK